MRHLPLRELGYAIGSIVALAALYVGSFYALVEIRESMSYSFHAKGSPERIYQVPVKYQIKGDFIRQLYEPMLKLDLHFRCPDRQASDGLLEKWVPYYSDERPGITF
jgi:hypothetical protein